MVMGCKLHLMVFLVLSSIIRTGYGGADEQQAGSIAQAVKDLGHAEYKVRDQAGMTLWSAGLAAEHALEQVSKSDDPEVALRARDILRKIRDGLIPGMSEQDQELVRFFHQGDVQDKVQIVNELLENNELEPNIIFNLIRHEKNERTRELLISRLDSAFQQKARDLIKEARFDLAQDYLALCSEGGNTSMMRALALVCMVCDNLDKTIAAIEKRDDTLSWRNRLLTYLYRGRGDLARSTTYAEKAAPRYYMHILKEQGRWQDLLELLHEEPDPVNVEWLGYNAALLRLTGRDHELPAACKALVNHARDIPDDAWFAAEALLINDEPDMALNLLIEAGNDMAAASLISMRQDRVGLERMIAEAEKETLDTERKKTLKRIATRLQNVTVSGLTPPLLAQAQTNHIFSSASDGNVVEVLRQARLDMAAVYAKEMDEQPDQPLPRYLRGWLLFHAGQEKEGALLMKQAVLMPLGDEKERYQLAQELARRGLDEAAKKQWDLLFLTADFDSWYLGEALQVKAGQVLYDHEDHERSAFFQELRRLQLLERNAGLLKPDGYLVFSWRIAWHRAHHALKQGAIDQALHYADMCLRALPGDIQVAIWLCPELEKRGRKADADKLFSAMLTTKEQTCDYFPKIATYHNDLAWLTARCRRSLDKGREHAQQAVELDPHNAAYIDTLAEVLFQLGKTEVAIKHMRTCIQLEPEIPYFQRQLNRFEAGDPSTDPEE